MSCIAKKEWVEKLVEQARVTYCGTKEHCLSSVLILKLLRMCTDQVKLQEEEVALTTPEAGLEITMVISNQPIVTFAAPRALHHLLPAAVKAMPVTHHDK